MRVNVEELVDCELDPVLRSVRALEQDTASRRKSASKAVGFDGLASFALSVDDSTL